jgi:hypothetical protein
MTNLSIYLAELAELSTNQFARLTPDQKFEADLFLDKLSTAVKLTRAKFDTALLQCYGERAKAALLESGRDFGTAHITDGPLRIKYDLPKKVTWDQPGLNDRLQRIVAAGEDVKSYVDVKLSVSEARYTNWPPALQQQFAGARTVDAGKPSFTLTLDQEVL